MTRRKHVNDFALFRHRQILTREQGLPRRSWFRHQVYAPGYYTGYGVKTLPGVREAIEQKRWSEANEQIVILAKVLDNYTSTLEKAASAAK